MVDFVPECIGFLLNLHPFFQICIGSAHKMCALNLMHRTCAVIQAARLIIIVQCNPAALYHRVYGCTGWEKISSVVPVSKR